MYCVGEPGCGHRARKEIALAFIALVLCEEPKVLGGLNALCDDLDTKVVRHRHDCAHDGGSVWFGHCFDYEALIDLEPVDRILEQIGEAAESSAKVIDGNASAELPDSLQFFEIRGGVHHERVFGQFHLETVRRQPALFESLVDNGEQIALLELAGR